MRATTEHIPVPFPTQGMANLFTGLQGNLHHLALLLGDQASAAGEPGRITHAAMLAEAEAILSHGTAAMALFLNYPTQRLSCSLIRISADAATTVAWLQQNPPADDRTADYAACCERIQSAIQEWRLAVEIESAFRNLEYQAPETLH